MMRRELSELSRSYGWLGFNEQPKRHSLKGLLYSLTVPFLLINEIAYVIFNWENLEKRVNGLKGLFQYMICSMFLVSVLFMWNKTKLIVKVIEEGHYQVTVWSTRQRTELIKQIQENAINMNTAWYYIIHGCVVGGMLTSVVVFLMKTAELGVKNLTAEMLYMPNTFYYPENYNSMVCYFISFLIQYFFWIQMSRNTYLVLVGSFVCMQLVEGDLKLLRLSVEEMESIIDCKINDSLCLAVHYRHTKMKEFLYNFVQNHYHMYRKVTEATKGTQLIAFSLSSGMSLMICTAIFILVKGNVFVSKLQEACICITSLCILYCINDVGEKISNEDDKLRQALYEIEWLDKPMWFKKSLQIIMTRTNKMIEIESVGLFTLNLRSFAMALRAAYSFYNALISFTK